MQFRYKIEDGTTTLYLKPAGEITLLRQKAGDEMGQHIWPKSLSELEILAAKDKAGYDYLVQRENSSDRCATVDLTVQQYKNGGWTTRFVGQFSMNDCEFDFNQCTVTVKAKENSIYQCLLKGKSKTINLMQCPTKVESNTATFEANWANMLFTLTYDGDVPADLITLDSTAISWYNVVNHTVNGHTVSVWVIYRTYTECISGNGVSPTLSYPATYKQYTECENGFAVWIAENTDAFMNGELFAFLNTSVVEGCEPQVGQLISMTDTEIGIPSPDGTCYSLIAAVDSYENIPNGVTLSDGLEYILGEICPGVAGVISDFFQINPENIATNNYVTGEPNVYVDPHIHQIADVKNPNATQASSRAEITFSGLMSDLYKMFRVKWFIDSSDNLRIEHESYFSLDGPQDYSSNPDKRYSYEKEVLSNIQKFKFASGIQYSIDFIGTEIIYDGLCVSDEPEEFVLNHLCSDYDYIVNDPLGSVPDTGLVIFSVDPVTDDVLWRSGILTGVFVQNMPMSWAYLHDKLHQYRRNQITGTMNGISTTFQSTKLLKRQTIETKDCFFEIDPSQPITTKIGTGEIESIEINFDTGYAEIEISL